MRGSIKTTLFMFSHLDYRAIEEYFEQMAQKGWMLEKIGNVTARFIKIEPQNLKFTVDIFPYTTIFDSPNNRDAQDYRDLCEQSGWRFLTSANKLNVFYAKAEVDPTPIQTDSVVEEKLIRQTVLGTELFAFVFCLPMFLLRIGALFPFDYSKLFTNLDIVTTVFFPILLLPITVYTGHYVFWFWKAKRNIKAGLPLPHTTLRAARFRGLFLLYVATLLVILMLVAAIADALGGHTIALYAMLLPVVSVAGGMWFRKVVANKNRTRRQNIALFVTTIAAITVVSVSAMNVLILGRHASWASIKEELPHGYLALKMSDFGMQELPRITSFSQSSSFIVPQSFDYYESSAEGSIRTRYIRATNWGIAKYVFDGMLKRSELLYNRVIFEAPAQEWNVDAAYYLTADRSMMILLKGNTVIYLDSKFDFAQPGFVDISRNRLQLE